MANSHADYPHLTSTQWGGVEEMVRILGEDAVERILSGDIASQVFAIDNFMRHNAQRYQRGEASISQPVVIQQPPQPRLKIDVAKYGGKEGESLNRWLLEIEIAAQASLITDSNLIIAFAMSNLVGKAKDWAFIKRMSDINYFHSWNDFKDKILYQFQPPYNEFKLRSAFLACKQGNRSLSAYIQEIQSLDAQLVREAFPESIKVTIFLQGLKQGPARNQLFRVHPQTLDRAIKIAMEENYSFLCAKGSYRDDPNVDQPMDLSNTEVNAVTCFHCNKKGHLRKDCYVLKRQQNAARRGGKGGKGGRGTGKKPVQDQGKE